MRWDLLVLGMAFSCVVGAKGVEAATEPGVAYVFFNQSDFRRPDSSGVQPEIRMDTKGVDFGWLWIGRIRFPAAAEVTFSAEADDGLRLFVGDKAVIDGPNRGDAREGEIRVGAGETLPLHLEYYQRGGDARLRLYWQWDGHPREPVPASALGHEQRDLELAQAIAAGRSVPTPGEPEVATVPMGDEADNSGIYRPQQQPARDGKPMELGPGPHLFLDESLIERSDHMKRRVNRPQRDPHIPNPLITGKEDECNGPYLTVIRDAKSGRFRIWYNTNKVKFKDGSSHVATMESEDGIHWIRPHRVLDDPGPFNYGSSVLDEGSSFADAAKRYKLAWWNNGGMRLAVSADGLKWTTWKPYPVIRHNHDITNIFYDSLRKRYLATISVYMAGPHWSGERRTTMQTASKDLLHWEKPWYVLTADDRFDPGQTQFYAMCGYLQRGDVLIGLVKVLHDDWRASGTPDGAFGMGYTALAWSHDGQHWLRDLEPFFEPDPKVGAWDHAHAWIDQQLPVGDEVYLYYGGYKFGHKMDRWEGRQIGMVKMQRDRYVSRDADGTEGTLRTPPVILKGKKLTVNAAVKGELRLQLVDEAGKPVAGFDAADCTPIRGDSLDHEVKWQGSLESLGGKPVRVEFLLNDGQLYGFALVK